MFSLDQWMPAFLHVFVVPRGPIRMEWMHKSFKPDDGWDPSLSSEGLS